MNLEGLLRGDYQSRIHILMSQLKKKLSQDFFVMPVEIGELTFYIFLEKETKENDKYRLHNFFGLVLLFI